MALVPAAVLAHLASIVVSEWSVDIVSQGLERTGDALVLDSEAHWCYEIERQLLDYLVTIFRLEFVHIKTVHGLAADCRSSSNGMVGLLRISSGRGHAKHGGFE